MIKTNFHLLIGIIQIRNWLMLNVGSPDSSPNLFRLMTTLTYACRKLVKIHNITQVNEKFFSHDIVTLRKPEMFQKTIFWCQVEAQMILVPKRKHSKRLNKSFTKKTIFENHSIFGMADMPFLCNGILLNRFNLLKVNLVFPWKLAKVYYYYASFHIPYFNFF